LWPLSAGVTHRTGLAFCCSRAEITPNFIRIDDSRLRYGDMPIFELAVVQVAELQLRQTLQEGPQMLCLKISVQCKTVACIVSFPTLPRKGLTFRPLTGSRITRVIGFLPASYQLPVSFRLRVRFRHGTDGRRPSMHNVTPRLIPLDCGIIRHEKVIYWQTGYLPRPSTLRIET